MATVSVPARETSGIGLTYTKRLRRARQLRFFGPLLAIVAYGGLGLHQWSALSAKVLSNNFYVQVALCWVPLWAICTAASLPALWYHFYLDQKFGLTKSRLSTWLLDSLKGKGLAFIMGGAIVEIAFVSHKLSPAHGWLWAGILCSLLFLGVIQLFPWLLSLFYPVAPLKNAPLQQRLNRLAMKAGVRLGIISEWRVSRRTRKANALVAGIGTSRRILLTDTLIAELSEDEVEAIVGHELGHCALHHVSQRVALQGVMFCGIFWLINLAVDNGLMLFVSENSD